MTLLSDDDTNLKGMTDEELELAWDLWFDLAQETNAFDPPYTHGVFAGVVRWVDAAPGEDVAPEPTLSPSRRPGPAG